MRPEQLLRFSEPMAKVCVEDYMAASMRPEQLLRFSTEIRERKAASVWGFNEAGAAAPVFLASRLIIIRPFGMLQ